MPPILSDDNAAEIYLAAYDAPLPPDPANVSQSCPTVPSIAELRRENLDRHSRGVMALIAAEVPALIAAANATAAAL